MEVEQPKPAKKKRRKRTPKRVSAELAIEKRREQVAKFRLAGWSTREIAAHLKCSIGTVSSDEKAVFERVREKTDSTVQRAKAISLARLDQITKGVWDGALTGDIDAGNLVLKIEKRRADLLGLDAPARQELTGRDGAPLGTEPTPENAARLVRERFGEHAAKPVESDGPAEDPAAAPIGAGEIPADPTED